MEKRSLAQTGLLVTVYLAHLAFTNGAENSIFYTYQLESSHTHSLHISWNVTDEVEVESCSVTHQKVGSQAITYSGTLYNLTDGYVIEDLIPEATYDVCLTLQLVGGAKCLNCTICESMSTIPLIRNDSLIALLLVIGVILLLVIIGLICWQCAKKRTEEPDEEEGSEEGSDESKQPILLSVPTGNGPRRSVDFEDQDIPYIDGEPIKDAGRTTNI